MKGYTEHFSRVWLKYYNNIAIKKLTKQRHRFLFSNFENFTGNSFFARIDIIDMSITLIYTITTLHNYLKTFLVHYVNVLL